MRHGRILKGGPLDTDARWMIAPGSPASALVGAALALPIGIVLSLVSFAWHEGDDERAVLGRPVCGGCGRERRWADLLRRPDGSCLGCRIPPPRSWWVAPTVLACGTAITLWQFGLGAATPALVWFLAVVGVASVVDLRLMLIPRHVVWVGVGVAVPLIAAASASADAIDATWWALAGGLGCAAFLGVFHLLMPAGLGFGDVRFGLLLGLYLGWVSPLLVPIGLAIGCVCGIVMGLIARAGWRAPFPFGPGLALGALIAIWGNEWLLGRLQVT